MDLGFRILEEKVRFCRLNYGLKILKFDDERS